MTPDSPTAGSMVGAGGSRLRTLSWTPGAEVVGRALLVHGLTEHAGRYGHVARALTNRGIAVLAFDLRGHGESEGPRGRLRSFDLLVEDVHRAREVATARLPGEGPPVLYGHSLGGLILLRYLQTYRPSTPGAVLSAPWLGTAVAIPWWKRKAVDLLLRWAPDMALSSGEVEATLLTRDPAMQRAYAEDPLVHHRLSPRFFREVESAQSRALEQGIDASIPTLVIVPCDDGLVDAERTVRWAESVQGGHVTVVRLEGVRHEPHNDVGREEVLETLGSWIRRRVEGGGPP